MSQVEILAQLSANKITPEEAAKLLGALEPTVKVVATQFASAAEFLAAARPVAMEGNGLSVELAPREFSTGSYGWSASGKRVVTLSDGKKVAVQGSINLVVIGSKPESKAA